MEVIYSKSDQELIDGWKDLMEEYDKSLILRIRRDGIHWAASEPEIKKAFMNDEGRRHLQSNYLKMMRLMMPEKIIFEQKQALNCTKKRWYENGYTKTKKPNN